MSQGQPSIPADLDDKTRQLKRFLDLGGTTALETLQRAETAPAVLSVPRPVTIDVPNGAGVAKQLAGLDAASRLFVSLAFGAVHAPDFILQVFVNTPEASTATPVTAAGYVGSVAFFSDPSSHASHEGTTYRLPATDAVRRTGAPARFTITLVPAPYGQRPATPQTIELTAALEFVRSTVKRAG